jgi:predicted ATPase
MKIESIRLKNFKTFRDVHLKDIPPFLVVVGANGTGKSTLFEVFGFLHDCLKGNVRQALDKRGRFSEVLSRGCDPRQDTILIELQYRMEITGIERLVTYSLEIGERGGAPVVQKELLRYKRGRYGSPYHFLSFGEGEGYAITNEDEFSKADEELGGGRRSQVKPSTFPRPVTTCPWSLAICTSSTAISSIGSWQRWRGAFLALRLLSRS